VLCSFRDHSLLWLFTLLWLFVTAGAARRRILRLIGGAVLLILNILFFSCREGKHEYKDD